MICTLYYEHDIFVRYDHLFCTNHTLQSLPTDIIPIPYSNNPQYAQNRLQNHQLYRYHFQQLQQQHTELVNEQANHQCYISYKNSDDKRIKAFCRISKANIHHLSTTYNILHDDLFVFYTICYRSSSYRYLEHIVNPARSTISRRFRDVLGKLHEHFVPTQLNKSWTRDKVKQNTPQFVRELFGLHESQNIFITDGFMVYCGKSENFDIQHREHNSYKKRNCWIFHPFICANGRYVINLGPFESDYHNTDQTIYESATDIQYLDALKDHHNGTHPMPEDHVVFNEENTDKLLWFNGTLYTFCDGCIADRGYTEIDDHRLECPPQLNKPRPKGRRKKNAPPPPPRRKQLPLEEANKFRQVTLARNTVERDYGRLKQWLILNGLIPYQFRDCINEIVEVLMATENEFFCAMTTDSIKNQRYMRRVLDHMRNVPLKVQPWLSERGWVRQGSLPSHCVAAIRSAAFIPDF